MDGDCRDTLYPSGTVYENTQMGRFYYSFGYTRDKAKIMDGHCYNVVCQTTSGGCNASIDADSKIEAVQAWNKRFTK